MREGYPRSAQIGSALWRSRCNLRDAVVRVDGEVWTGFEGLDRVVVELGEGIHTVEVRRDGYRTYQTNVEIVEGDTTLLNVSLPAAEDVR